MPKFRQRSFLNRKFNEENKLIDIKASQGTYKDVRRDFISGVLTFGETTAEKEDSKSDFSKITSQTELNNLIKNKILDDDGFSCFFSNFMHQGGISRSLHKGLLKASNEAFNALPHEGKGDIKCRIHLKKKGDSLVIKEKTELFNLRSNNNPERTIFNLDNSGKQENPIPLLSSEATYFITKNKKNEWEARIIDVIFDYKNNKIKEAFDNRGFFAKVKDWFKSKLNMNQEKNIEQGVSRDPKYIFNSKPIEVNQNSVLLSK